MSYLRRPRTQRLLLLVFASSLLLASMPSLDLYLSGRFFDGRGFQLKNQWWPMLLHESVGYLIALGLTAVVGIYAFNRFSGRAVRGVDGKLVGFLVLVLVLGAGLIVNGVFKNGFGRARPRNVVQFGGSQTFSPAFVVSDACDSNCSFSSGDAAGAFFAIGLAHVLFRRRAALLAAAAFGGLVAYARIASGAHFFSDVVVSLFVMGLVADATYFYLFRPARGVVAPLEPVAIAAPESSDGEVAELDLLPLPLPSIASE